MKNRWDIKWEVKKYKSSKSRENGEEPVDVIDFSQNLILYEGTKEMMLLISGLGGIPFNTENTRVFVGGDSTPTAFLQMGILSNGEKSLGKHWTKDFKNRRKPIALSSVI